MIHKLNVDLEFVRFYDRFVLWREGARFLRDAA